MHAHRAAGVLLIEGAAADGWIVGGRLVRDALLIAGAAAWSVRRLPLVEAGALFGPLADVMPRPELLLIGTGAVLERAPPAVIAAGRALGLRVETMDSRAAARTYNVLAGEGRAVAALLL